MQRLLLTLAASAAALVAAQAFARPSTSPTPTTSNGVGAQVRTMAHSTRTGTKHGIGTRVRTIARHHGRGYRHHHYTVTTRVRTHAHTSVHHHTTGLRGTDRAAVRANPHSALHAAETLRTNRARTDVFDDMTTRGRGSACPDNETLAGGGERQGDPERGAAAGPVGDGHGSAVALDHLLDDGEPEPGAATIPVARGLEPQEGFEDALAFAPASRYHPVP